MQLLVCLISYNRLKYTKKTLKSFIDTITCPYYLVVVDNNSNAKTKKWLEENGPQDLLILNPYNFYPGRACNEGWERGLKSFPNATHLMRLDNDMQFEKGWDDKVEEYFEAINSLGQLGLDDTALETYNGNEAYLTSENGKTINLWPGNVGGPCVISREVYDCGIRYDEQPWHHDGGLRPTAQEDAKLSMDILVKGFKVGHPTERLAWTFANESNWNEYPKYYQKTMKERGYDFDIPG